MQARPRQLALLLLGASLAVLATTKVRLVLVGLSAPFEHDYGESSIYAQAALLLHGVLPYHPLGQPPWTITAYPPLYYLVAAGLQAALGPGFIWGRVLSLASGVAAAACIAWLTWRTSGSRPAALFGVAIFFGLGFVGAMPWFGLYRIDMLGVALSLAAIVVLSRGTSTRALITAGLLAGLAMLTKQTLVAAALAGSVWLLTIRRRQAMVFGGSALLLAGVTCAALELATRAFVANAVLSNLNPFQMDLFEVFGVLLLFTQGMPLLLVSVYLLRARPWRSTPERLLVFYWIASALPLLGMGKIGANTNYWIEFAASTAVLAALGLWTTVTPAAAARRSSALRSMVVLSVCSLYAAGAVASGAASVTWQSAQVLSDWRRDHEADFWQLADRVRAEPRNVLAEPQDILVLANRPIVFDPLAFGILTDTNAWDPRPVVDMVCSGKVGLLILIDRLEELPQHQIRGYEFWPPAVTAALRASMTFDREQAGRFVYVGRPASAPSGCAPAPGS